MSAPRLDREVVSFVVRQAATGRLFMVLRPEDDPDLPNVWGLPAGRRRAGESWQEAVKRAGREKLGLDLEVGPLLNQGEMERSDYRLQMRLYEAAIVTGEPKLQQAAEGTSYRAWRWAFAADLQPAAQRGSLCCRLFLELHPS